MAVQCQDSFACMGCRWGPGFIVNSDTSKSADMAYTTPTPKEGVQLEDVGGELIYFGICYCYNL